MNKEEKANEIVFLLKKIINECSTLNLEKMSQKEIAIIFDHLTLIEKYFNFLKAEKPMKFKELKKEIDLLLKLRDLNIS